MTTTPNDRSLRLIPLGLAVVVALVLGMVWLMRETLPPLPVIHQLQAFTLTNQSGVAVRLSDLKGCVWVANIIFTRCPGPCLQMSRRMAALQKRWASEPGLRFVSLTTDPDYDTPDILKAYLQRVEGDAARWHFLTGPKDEIARLAMDGLKLSAQENPPSAREKPEDLFVHSTISVVIDRHGRLRASVEVLEEGSEAKLDDYIGRLLHD